MNSTINLSSSSMSAAPSLSSAYTSSNVSGAPRYANPFPLPVQGGQWGYGMPQNLHPLFAVAAQMQSNAWSPHIHTSMHQNHNQQTMPFFNTRPQMLPMTGMLDASPVGSLPDDDSRLAQALHDSTNKGQTYKQAIEGLHGVCRVCYFFPSDSLDS